MYPFPKGCIVAEGCPGVFVMYPFPKGWMVVEGRPGVFVI